VGMVAANTCAENGIGSVWESCVQGQDICSGVFFFFNCCSGCGYIIPFTKVFTMYQIYHT
jgi:hypothetical protein